MLEREALATARRELERRGFAVLTSPTLPNVSLPEWFEPDLVGVQGDRVIVVELKSAQAELPPGYLARVERFAVARGWDFMLWRFDPYEVEAPLDVSETSVQWLDPSAAVNWPTDLDPRARRVLAESARAEAVIRALARTDAERELAGERRADERWGMAPAPDDREGWFDASRSWSTALRYLAVRGFVEPYEYSVLREGLTARDAWVHGLNPSLIADVGEGAVERLGQLPADLVERAREIWRRAAYGEGDDG